MNATAIDTTTGSRKKSTSAAKLAIRLGAFAAFALIWIYFAATARGFLSPFNMMNVLEQSTVLALMAYAMTVVFIGTGTDVQKGGIDLSIAANAGLCGAVMLSWLKMAMVIWLA